MERDLAKKISKLQMLRLSAVILITFCTSCWNQNHRLIVRSKYKGTVDSLVLRINGKILVKVINVKDALDTVITYSSKEIKSGHDIIVEGLLYHNSGKVLDGFTDFNDLGYIPNRTEILVTDSMKLKYSMGN